MEYLFPGAHEENGYLLFPAKLERDDLVAFMGQQRQILDRLSITGLLLPAHFSLCRSQKAVPLH